MISIIVCSINDELFEKFSRSLNDTVGIPYEVIRINNKTEKLGICAAYNKGAQLARYEHLAFIHENVIFKTEGWGRKLLKHFRELNNVGVLGVAGSDCVLHTPCGWWDVSVANKYVHIIDGVAVKNYQKINAAEPRQVIVLDGVFLATTRKFWEANKFDERIDGFHAYDMSFCMNASTHACNYFVHDILMDHNSSMSSAKLGFSFYANNLQVRSLFAGDLPLALTCKASLKQEMSVAYAVFYQILRLHIDLSHKWKLLAAYYSWNSERLGSLSTAYFFCKSVIKFALKRGETR